MYDLNVNKHEPIGSEQPRLLRKEDAKSKMTHVSFNPGQPPIIVVGDDRGVIRTFKLGPNLHKMTAPTLADLNAAEEQAKLERLLIIPDKTAESEALNSLNLIGPLPPIANKPAQAQQAAQSTQLQLSLTQSDKLALAAPKTPSKADAAMAS